MQRCFIVDRDLFSRVYVAQGDEENVIIKNLHECVRSARVIYVMSPVSSSTSIQTPATIDFTDSEHLSMCSAPSLSVRDLFARVLGDLMSLLEKNRREAALTVYRRGPDC